VLGPTDPQLATLTGQTLQVPFWSLAQGYVTNPGDALSQPPATGPNRGQDYSLLRGSTNTVNGVLDIGVATDHPYRRKELLRKIYNSVTTRSNVFAIWLTVGYFEIDANGKLMAEIGKAENRQIRHRMFAIVDRTQMTLLPSVGQDVSITTLDGNPLTAGQTSQLLVQKKKKTVVTIPDPRTGNSLTPQDGMFLVLEPNTDNEETVKLFTNMGQFFFTVQKAHPAQMLITLRGNPGPWIAYDPRQDTDVVPYWALID
jgi:hypothetical protein